MPIPDAVLPEERDHETEAETTHRLSDRPYFEEIGYLAPKSRKGKK